MKMPVKPRAGGTHQTYNRQCGAPYTVQTHLPTETLNRTEGQGGSTGLLDTTYDFFFTNTIYSNMLF